MTRRIVFTFLFAAVAGTEIGAAQSADSPAIHTVMEAVEANRPDAVARLLASGVNVNATAANGRTALMEAVTRGQLETVRLLIEARADLNLSDRGAGTALEIAERSGHSELAALLRRAGAQTSGRSIGDKVCVRPWKGAGYCGDVEGISEAEYRIRVTEVVGCGAGCTARSDCSEGKPVAGEAGIRPGATVRVPPSCITHTGVAR